MVSIFMRRQNIMVLACMLALSLPAHLGLYAAEQPDSGAVAREAREPLRLAGSTSPQVARALDAGRVSGNEIMQGVTLLLRQTPAQRKAVQKLFAEQQTPGTRRFRKWITPAQYAGEFGLPESAIEKVAQWLTSEGFSSVSVNVSHTALSFDGNTALIEQIFSTEIHRYSFQGEMLLANAVDIQLPLNIRPYIDGVKSISQFRPMPQVGSHRGVTATPELSSPGGDEHYLSPGDIAKVYDFNQLLSGGDTGKGGSIAVVGQSSVRFDDVARFRAAAGVGSHLPKLILVPGTGAPIKRAGDELESDIDLEYAGATAPDADVTLVYTGSDSGHNVFDALAYAVDHDIAPVISMSYGACETGLLKSEIDFLERALEQAALQGETVLVSSGDLGAAGCETQDSQVQGIASHGLAVQYPSSSQYVTSVGGTMFDDSASTSYWGSGNASDGGFARVYIPEQAWNESTGPGRIQLLGGGGGASALFPKPVWQTAPGVPVDGARDVPDIALAAGVHHDGFVFCSSDQEAGIQGSCSHGFLDAGGSRLAVAGGTSFGAPVAAGMVVLLEQRHGAGRLGNLNPLLYALASAAPKAFHDIIVGDNRQPCAAGSKDCGSNGMLGFLAGQGYDQATGLGSPDIGQLAEALDAAISMSSESGPVTSTPAAFALSSASLDPPEPDQAASVITVKPSAKYAGLVKFQVATSDPLLARYGCYVIRDVAIQAGMPAHTTLLAARSPAACAVLASQQGGTAQMLYLSGQTALVLPAQQFSHAPRTSPELALAGSAAELCGVLILGGLGRRLRYSAASLVTLFGIVTLCTGCSVHLTGGQAAPGQYLLAVTGTDAEDPAQAASVSVPVKFR